MKVKRAGKQYPKTCAVARREQHEIRFEAASSIVLSL